MSKKTEAATCRDHSVFSKISAEAWREYAGKVLAINPETDEILAVGESESSLEATHTFDCHVVEFFHVPAAGTLSVP